MRGLEKKWQDRITNALLVLAILWGLYLIFRPHAPTIPSIQLAKAEILSRSAALNQSKLN